MTLTPDDKLRFGKYYDAPLWRVIETDPSYVRWCIENVDGFELDDEAFELLEKHERI